MKILNIKHDRVFILTMMVLWGIGAIFWMLTGYFDFYLIDQAGYMYVLLIYSFAYLFIITLLYSPWLVISQTIAAIFTGLTYVFSIPLLIASFMMLNVIAAPIVLLFNLIKVHQDEALDSLLND